MVSTRRTPSFQVPLTPRLLAALFVGSLFASFIAAHLAETFAVQQARREQAKTVQSVAADLARRAAPLLERGDDLRLAMVGAAAAQFGDFRVVMLGADGQVRLDTGMALGGRKVQLLTEKGAFTRTIENGRHEHLAPVLAVSGIVGEVRVRYPESPGEIAGFPWSVFGGSLLACLSLLALAGAICHHWMRHIREAVATAQGMAHGDLTAHCERRAGGVILDLQDSLHDLGTALGSGVQQVQRSFLELAHQTVEVLERRGSTGHSERTCAYAMLLGNRLGLTPEEAKDLEVAARLHDLGEVFEPAMSAERTTEETLMQRLRRVPQRGAELLSGIANLRRVTEIVRHYRERFDGNGFPAGLHGERIPLGARVLSIADAFDQLTTMSVGGQQPMSWEEALGALRQDRGETFDPWLVDLFEEEIRKSPSKVETVNTVMISTAGVMPYTVAKEGRTKELIEETSLSSPDDWYKDELEVEEDEFLHLGEATVDDWLPEDENVSEGGSR